MTKRNHTMRALLASVLSLLLCFSMLIGSTFAWFTDSATTGVNTIVAGNLDIGLYEGTVTGSTITYNTTEVTSETKLFDDKALWEPGHTEVAYLKVTNNGSLALKYIFTVNAANEVAGTNVDDKSFNLSDYLMYDIIPLADDATCYATRAAALAAAETNAKKLATESIEGEMEATDKAKCYALVVYMPENTGNEANYKTNTTAPSIELGVTLVATQFTSEEDSFDNTYDKDSKYPQTSSANVTEAGDAVVKTENFTVKVPANASEQSAAGDVLTLDIAETAVPEAVVITDSDVLVGSFDVNLTNQNGEKVTAAANNIEVEVDIGTGMGTIVVYHNGAEIPSTYDSATGILKFNTSSFSPYTIVEKDAFKITATPEDFATNLGNAVSGDTIKLTTTEKVVLDTDIPAGVEIVGVKGNEPTLTVPNKNGANLAAGTKVENVIIEDANTSNGRYYAGIVNVRGANATINNAKIVGKGATTWDAAVYVNLKAGETAYISNSDIKGGFRGIFLGSQSGSLVVDNCVINPIAYTISVDGGGDFSLTVRNSEINGWTSYSAIKSASFENTKFGSNGSYAFFRPYSGTTLTGCDFAAGYEIDANQTTDEIIFTNCTFGGAELTVENAAELFGGTIPANVIIK